MYDIENCYKMIFESMLDEYVLESLAHTLGEYTKSWVLFVSVSGEILTSFCGIPGYIPKELKGSHIKLEEYEAVWHGAKFQEFYKEIMHVCHEKKTAGYVVWIYREIEDKPLFEELCAIVSRTAGKYFAGSEKQYFAKAPLIEQIIGRLIFEEEKSSLRLLENKIPGGYTVVMFRKDKTKPGFPGAESWRGRFVGYEKEQYAAILCYGLRQKDYEKLCENAESQKRELCVSELFSDICMCRSKYQLLKRVEAAGEADAQNGVKREKEWFVRGLYTYTMPLIEESGLDDYHLQELIQQDEENNTELYNTLKMYLLCENNVTTAAEKMHIHRNTLVYRLRKIKEYVGLDINDNEISRDLLAFMMMFDTAGMVEEK